VFQQQYAVKWSRHRRPLPSNSLIRGNVLSLENVRIDDTDRYYCKVESPYGTTFDYIDLNVLRK